MQQSSVSDRKVWLAGKECLLWSIKPFLSTWFQWPVAWSRSTVRTAVRYPVSYIRVPYFRPSKETGGFGKKRPSVFFVFFLLKTWKTLPQNMLKFGCDLERTLGSVCKFTNCNQDAVWASRATATIHLHLITATVWPVAPFWNPYEYRSLYIRLFLTTQNVTA